MSSTTPEVSLPYELWIHNLTSAPLITPATNHPNKKNRLDVPSTLQGGLSQTNLRLEQDFFDLANEQAQHHKTRTTFKTAYAFLSPPMYLLRPLTHLSGLPSYPSKTSLLFVLKPRSQGTTIMKQTSP